MTCGDPAFIGAELGTRMATVGAEWHTGQTLAGQNVADPQAREGYDIHVLRGTTSVPLRSILLLREDTGNAVRADSAVLPSDVVDVTFQPRFAGTPTGTVFAGHGVSVDTGTGEVTATLSPPAPRLRSFRVEPVISLASGSITGPPVRVCIHETVDEIWLTPSTLTLPGDAAGQRFTVLARFADDTIGDITRLAGAPPAAGQPPEPGFDWASSSNVCASVDPQGRLSGSFVLFPCSATITAKIKQPGWPVFSATAEVIVVDEWGNPPPGRAELHLLSGPGLNSVADVPNILILPDGFLDTRADRDDFSRLAGRLVQRLTTNGTTAPFNLFGSTSINYWSAFVPSRERGTTTLDGLMELASLFAGTSNADQTPLTSVAVDGLTPAGAGQIDFDNATLRGELPAGTHFTIAGDPTLYTTRNMVRARNNAVRRVRFTPVLAQAAAANAVVTIIGRRAAVPRGVPAPPGPNPWTLENLLHVVGLPVPAERLPRRANAADLASKVAEWVTLYGPAVQRARITAGVYDLWGLVVSDHRLADEQDTAFGLAIAERPRAAIRRAVQAITWHPLRTTRAQVDRFLETLTFRGTAIGRTWTFQPGGAPSKDRELVFILARGARLSGSRTVGREQLVAMGLTDDLDVRARYGAGRSMQTVPHPLPRDRANRPVVTNHVHATLAHESAHSFGVGDEYGGLGTLPAGGVREQRSLQDGNVTPASEVAVAGGITGDALRWRWPRIRKAGVLAASPRLEPGAPGVFAIQLRPGHQTTAVPGGDVFQAGDLVFLRQRPLLRPPGTPPRLNHALVSPPLEVIAPTRALVADELQVRVQSGTLTPADFSGTGADAAILFEPVPAAASAAAAGDRDAELMAQLIRAHITASRGPLNAPPANPTRPCAPPGAPGHMEAQAATNLPAAASFPGGTVPAIPSRIVGAYEGGGVFDCGIFHPRGLCIMRAPLATATERPITRVPPGAVHSFCPVCRYLLVDRIDPRQHGAIDRLYRTYPQP